MHPMRKSVLALTVALLLPSAAPAQDLLAGFDLYETFDLSTLNVQVPADFFYPGSDPFFQTRDFDGVPLVSSPHCPSVALGNTDTIIQRLSDASFPVLPSSDTVPIEIVAMQLTMVGPIAVTGIQPNELWDVDLDLSPTAPSVGSMTMTKVTCPCQKIHRPHYSCESTRTWRWKCASRSPVLARRAKSEVQ